ncbi:DNA/RNA non-specific endonuclease [Pacificispira sp.]|uniref:DNA/RNA non-specific endonuclease n=1 Tax=Pacificispira sp. TaxID=2888761 RepID=UPI003B51E2C8
MKKNVLIIFVGLLIAFASSRLAAEAREIELIYPGFVLQFDCDIGGATAAFYEVGPDSGDIDRDHSFFLDSKLPAGCSQQLSTDTYQAPPTAPYKYDRGHLVPANHLDGDADAISASNVMTNITPQHSSFNRSGAWRETEKRIECWRDEADKGPLQIWIGVVWGKDEANDHFVGSHGIVTPDSFVKLVYRPLTREAIAWFLPNGPLTAADLDHRVVEPFVVEAVLGESLPLEGVDKMVRARPENWPVPNCSQS